MDRVDGETVRMDAECGPERQKREIEEFWHWAPEWMEMTGNSERELLRQFPSFKGTRPSRANASAA
jgi:hypothetical protein